MKQPNAMNERERELWERTIKFVKNVYPNLDIKDVMRTAEKIYRKMHFVTKMPSIIDQLSNLERQRVRTEARETLSQMFNALHNRTGWCGDIMDEPWEACLPILEEKMARLIMRTR